MVSSANRKGLEVGGHIATYQSSASLYEVGFNHFFRGKDHPGGGDQIYIQGHASPGIYARAFLEGRLDRGAALPLPPGGPARRRRQGLSSYPHPRLMPDFWEFPTVSMGLTGINSIYQARFNRYLQNRGIKDTSDQHVWAFLGDGEMGEPESLGAIRIAAREELDNLTWVINCNLQQLDGPVTGNGKIIQELEANFRGAGWNVIKVVWGREWDPLLARDVDGVLVNRMNTTPDGQFQTYSIENGAYIREHFFGGDPRLRKMVEHMTDDQIEKLPRGGHDYRKVYAAFDAATKHVGQPTVILAKTIKGWTIDALEGKNATHQMKKLTHGRPQEVPGPALPADLRPRPRAGLRGDRRRAVLPPRRGRPRDRVHDGAPQAARRLAAQAGARAPSTLKLPGDEMYAELKQGSGKNKHRHHDGRRPAAQGLDEGPRDRQADRADRAGRVPHVRHGLDVPEREGLQPGRPAVRVGRPQACCSSYKESAQGQMLHEGISEAGAMASATAAGLGVLHARRAHDPVLHLLLDVRVPADRRLDLGDGRPAGPRLPDRRHRRPHHADRRGPAARRRALAAARRDQPGGRALRPGVRLRDQPHHAVRPRADVRRRRRGRHLLPHRLQRAGRAARRSPRTSTSRASCAASTRSRPPRATGPRVQLLASGVGFPWINEAAAAAAPRSGASRPTPGRSRRGTSWPATPSRPRSGTSCTPARQPRTAYVTDKLAGAHGPVVAVSDYMRAVPLQIARWVPGDYRVLGADGFGFADTRPAARRFFHIDAESVVVQALQALADAGEVDREKVERGVREVPHRRPDRRRRREAGGRRRLSVAGSRRR